MANLTLNQLVKQIEAFGQTHPQLQAVRFKPPIDALDRGDIRYPAFLFDYNGARKDGNLLVMRFTGWVFDLMLKEAENEQEVWSDTTRIACDILAYLDTQDDFSLGDGVTIENRGAGARDLTAGVTFDFTLSTRFAYGVCVEPERPAGGDFNHDFNDDFSGGVNTSGGDFNEDFNDDFSGGAGAEGDDFNSDFNNDFSGGGEAPSDDFNEDFNNDFP